MSRADGVKITETAISIFGEKHPPFFVMEPLRRADGSFPDAIIVATQEPSHLVPRELMLPHQLYTDTAARILAKSGQRNLWVLPVYSSSDWTQVDITTRPTDRAADPEEIVAAALAGDEPRAGRFERTMARVAIAALRKEGLL